MKKQKILITAPDHARLSDMIAFGSFSSGRRGALHALECELARAEIVAQNEIPADVITMNTRAELFDLDTGCRIGFTVVFPDEANIAEGKVSVLSPLGTGMLGYRVGDAFEWPAVNGTWRLKVSRVQYQPDTILAVTI